MEIGIGGKGNQIFEESNILILRAENQAEKDQLSRIINLLKMENLPFNTQLCDSYENEGEIYIEIKR